MITQLLARLCRILAAPDEAPDDTLNHGFLTTMIQRPKLNHQQTRASNLPAVLWDLDGTLIDTAVLHYKTWIDLLKPYRGDFPFSSFKAAFGMTNVNALNLWLNHPSDELIAELSQVKEETYRRNVPGNIQVLPGVIDWLQRFQSWGWPQAVASSAPMENIDVMIDEAGLRPYFDLLASAEDLPSKPDPAVFQRAAQGLSVPPARCVVIEDAVAGIDGARAAGMKSIAVLNSHPASSFPHASLIVPTLADLQPDQVKSLFQSPK